jgi:hypothetical protein
MKTLSLILTLTASSLCLIFALAASLLLSGCSTPKGAPRAKESPSISVSPIEIESAEPARRLHQIVNTNFNKDWSGADLMAHLIEEDQDQNGIRDRVELAIVNSKHRQLDEILLLGITKSYERLIRLFAMALVYPEFDFEKQNLNGEIGSLLSSLRCAYELRGDHIIEPIVETERLIFNDPSRFYVMAWINGLSARWKRQGHSNIVEDACSFLPSEDKDLAVKFQKHEPNPAPTKKPGSQMTHHASSTTCNPRQTRIYFANGMFNTPATMELSFYSYRHALFEQLQDENPIWSWSIYPDRYARIAKNFDEGMYLLPVIEVIYQKGFDMASRFVEWVYNQSATPFSELESLRNDLRIFDSLDSDLLEQVSDYERDLERGLNVLVIAHSQGNLYTKWAYQKLNDSHIPDLESRFHVISVASPVRNVTNSATSVIDPKDAVIKFIPDSAGTPSWALHELSLSAHSFIDGYMKNESIRNDILDFSIYKLFETPRGAFRNNRGTPLHGWEFLTGSTNQSWDGDPSWSAEDVAGHRVLVPAYKLGLLDDWNIGVAECLAIAAIDNALVAGNPIAVLDPYSDERTRRNDRCEEVNLGRTHEMLNACEHHEREKIKDAGRHAEFWGASACTTMSGVFKECSLAKIGHHVEFSTDVLEFFPAARGAINKTPFVHLPTLDERWIWLRAERAKRRASND